MNKSDLRHHLRVLAVPVLSLLTSCASEKDYLVTISTDFGDMHAVLYDETPKHKENFIELAKKGFYDSLLFHRVMQDFMIQGGDPTSKETDGQSHMGARGPGYTIPAEFNSHYFHKKGALAAARQEDNVNPKKESSGSQFYIVQGKKWTKEELMTDMEKLGKASQQLMERSDQDSIKQLLINTYRNEGPEAYGNKLMEMKEYISSTMQEDLSSNISAEKLEVYTTIGGAPHLDDEYTVFGQVIDGLEVIDKIAAQPVSRNNKPIDDVRMMVKVEEMARNKISKMYGYEYPKKEKK